MKSSSRKIFDVICLSTAAGLILYWVMFTTVLPRLMRPQALISLPLVSGIVGAAACALIYLGGGDIISALRARSKTKSLESLVLRRDSSGKVVAIGRTESVTVPKSPAPRMEKQVLKSEKEKPSKRSLGGYVKFSLLAVLVVGGYFGGSWLAGYTAMDVARGVYSPFLAVSSGSMEPTLVSGDLVLVTKASADEIEVGDIIAFNVPESYLGHGESPVIHRVIAKVEGEDGVYFVTKGDVNASEDAWLVPEDAVIGEYRFKIPYLGAVVLFIKTPLALTIIAAFFAISLGFSYLRTKRAAGDVKDE